MAVPPWEVERGERTCPDARHASQRARVASRRGDGSVDMQGHGRESESARDLPAPSSPSVRSNLPGLSIPGLVVRPTGDGGSAVKYMMLIYLDEAWARLTTAERQALYMEQREL